MERIICSAIWYRDDKTYIHQPKNIDTGFVVCGLRHHNCFATLSILNPSYVEGANKQNIMQGFLTSEDNFVKRNRAFDIAKEAKQIISREVKEDEYGVQLLSEDLY